MSWSLQAVEKHLAHGTLSISLTFCNLRSPRYNLLCAVTNSSPVAVVSLGKLFLQAEGRATTVCRGREAVMLMVEQRLMVVGRRSLVVGGRLGDAPPWWFLVPSSSWCSTEQCEKGSRNSTSCFLGVHGAETARTCVGQVQLPPMTAEFLLCRAQLPSLLCCCFIPIPLSSSMW